MTSRELTVPTTPPRLPATPPLRREISGTAWLGILVLVLFFGAGGYWAATAPIAGATIADGVVSPEGRRQTIQHLEGGIIRDIKVRDGDKVTAGQTLVVLEDVIAQAQADELLTRLRALAATEARLSAERVGDPKIAFDHMSLAERDHPEVQAVLKQQVNQFQTRKANDESRLAILAQRIAQLDQQIVGARRQLDGVRRQNELVREEISMVGNLVRKGLAEKPRLLALKRAEAELMGAEGELLSEIARSEEAIGETRMQMINLKTDRIENIDQQLAEVQAQRIGVQQQIRESLDRLSRTTITAPTDGTVLNLRFRTTGGVIRPGEPVLDLVPAADELIIEARVSPNDIDDVHNGLSAYVTFPSYPQRRMKRLYGEVIHVSADTLEDERSGERYYTAKINVDPQDLAELAPQIELTPGLPTQVFIATTNRTLLEYLLQPFLQSLERTFRES